MALTTAAKDGTVTIKVSASYSLKESIAPYESNDAYSGLSAEFEVDASADLEKVLSEAADIEAALFAASQLAVFAHLDADVAETSDGILVPKQKITGKAAATAPAPADRPTHQPSSAAAPASNGGGGGQRKDFGPPKASRERIDSLPVVVLGGVAYRDLRELKADGTYSPKSADFKPIAKGGQSLWLTSQDGTVNDNVAELLEAGSVGSAEAPF